LVYRWMQKWPRKKTNHHSQPEQATKWILSILWPKLQLQSEYNLNGGEKRQEVPTACEVSDHSQKRLPYIRASPLLTTSGPCTWLPPRLVLLGQRTLLNISQHSYCTEALPRIWSLSVC
jgi:hypothetical protein